MTGYPDETLRPNQEITRAEAVTALNRVLGRDESHTTVSSDFENPFFDLAETSWAYANFLEAAGMMKADIPNQNSTMYWKKQLLVGSLMKMQVMQLLENILILLLMVA